jgi:hypothetical protein
MSEPMVNRLQEVLPLGSGEDLKFLRSLNRHVVVRDLALEARLGWFSDTRYD